MTRPVPGVALVSVVALAAIYLRLLRRPVLTWGATAVATASAFQRLPRAWGWLRWGPAPS
jgi:hypothetical protein